MTCIAAIIDKDGKGHIASDSLGSNGHTKANYKNKKVFKKGDMLIGYTSSYRMGQILEYSLELPPRKVKQNLDKYMYIDFINAVRQLLKIHGFSTVQNNTEEIGTFIVVTEGHIFKVQSDLAILESRDKFDACGSGEDYAIAVLHTLVAQNNTNCKAMLTQAIDTASQYVSSVGPATDYLSQK